MVTGFKPLFRDKRVSSYPGKALSPGSMEAVSPSLPIYTYTNPPSFLLLFASLSIFFALHLGQRRRKVKKRMGFKKKRGMA